jgi:hypothetical protein
MVLRSGGVPPPPDAKGALAAAGGGGAAGWDLKTNTRIAAITAKPANAIGSIGDDPAGAGAGAGDGGGTARAPPRPAPQAAQNLAPGALALPQEAQA